MTANPDAASIGVDGSDRVLTGISGLDDILAGGLPRDRLYLVEGMPGTGKTTLALQFLLEGLRVGERGMYVTLAETADEPTGFGGHPRVVPRRTIARGAGPRRRPWSRAGADPAPSGRV